MKIEEYPWERLQADEQPHNHAFVFQPNAIRSAMVSQRRNGKYVLVLFGFTGRLF